MKEGTGRIARFELVPLSELGRPRVDVLCNMSGIFRDSFQNVVEVRDCLIVPPIYSQDRGYICTFQNGVEARGCGFELPWTKRLTFASLCTFTFTLFTRISTTCDLVMVASRESAIGLTGSLHT